MIPTITILVLVFLRSIDIERRFLLRQSLITELQEVENNAIGVKLCARALFVVGLPNRPSPVQSKETLFYLDMLQYENNTFGDVHVLDKMENSRFGKLFHAYQSISLSPLMDNVDYIMRIDSDTYFYWPHFAKIVPAVPSSRYVLLGRHMPGSVYADPVSTGNPLASQYYTSGAAGGELIMMSTNLVRAVVEDDFCKKHTLGPADVVLAKCIDHLGEEHGLTVHKQLYRPPDYFSLWVHKVKDLQQYWKCFSYRCRGEAGNEWRHPRHGNNITTDPPDNRHPPLIYRLHTIGDKEPLPPPYLSVGARNRGG